MKLFQYKKDLFIHLFFILDLPKVMSYYVMYTSAFTDHFQSVSIIGVSEHITVTTTYN